MNEHAATPATPAAKTDDNVTLPAAPETFGDLDPDPISHDLSRARELESDFALGVKKPVDDICWYENWLKGQFRDTYRHKESQTIYDFVGIGFAATGQGTIATMVHYKPHGMQGPIFERQLEPFRQKFEAVCQHMTWETMA